MPNIKQIFNIHPVGQGLFYSGAIRYSTRNGYISFFNFVFDCGSLTANACEEEVDELLQTESFNANQPIDLLVISHFDADHVSCIGRLLGGGRQVKNLILPFMNFEERLFLALRFWDNAREVDGATATGDFPVRFIVDPIGTLGDNLDGDTNIYYLNTGGPIAPNTGLNKDFIEENQKGESENQHRFSFDFEGGCAKLGSEEKAEIKNSSTGANLFKALDSQRGMIKSALSGVNIMDFIFYKKSIGKNERQFYEKVSDIFLDQFKIDKKATDVLKKVVDQIKKIKDASEIKQIFRKASESIPVNGGGRDVINMNTTAICLLHRNLQGMYNIVGLGRNERRGVARMHGVFKFNGKKIIHNIRQYYMRHFSLPLELIKLGFQPFPNILLASDSYLLEANEVREFTNHYKNYWNHFFLAQIPHHGSKNNSNRILFSKFIVGQLLFINYGITHKLVKFWQHPSEETISDLTLTGHSSNLFPVHETFGIRNILEIHN